MACVYGWCVGIFHPPTHPPTNTQVGGYQSFAAQSPAVLLARAVRKEKTTRVTKPATMHRPMPPSITSTAHGGAHQPSSYYDQFPLHGEAISHRIGMERSWTNMALEVARGDVDDGDDEDDGGCLPVDMDAAGRLPPTVLMSSCTDLTVPWYDMCVCCVETLLMYVYVYLYPTNNTQV